MYNEIKNRKEILCFQIHIREKWNHWVESVGLPLQVTNIVPLKIV
jgi:hypothetical protein